MRKLIISSILFFFYCQDFFCMIRPSAHCTSCEGGVAPLNKDQITEYLVNLPRWTLVQEKHYKIQRIIIFDTFSQAMEFVNKVASIAEREGHHPDIFISYNRVTIQLYTYAISGLSINDFILSTSIEEIIQKENMHKKA